MAIRSQPLLMMLPVARAGDKLLLNFMHRNMHLLFNVARAALSSTEIQLPFLHGEFLEIENGQYLQNLFLHSD